MNKCVKTLSLRLGAGEADDRLGTFNFSRISFVSLRNENTFSNHVINSLQRNIT